MKIKSMISYLIKVIIYTTTLVLFNTLEHRPLWAFSNTYTSVTSPNNADESTDTSNSEENDSVLPAVNYARTTNLPSETTNETTYSTNSYYKPYSASDAHVSSYTPAYTTTLAKLSSTLPQRRKVPEPSVMLGLIAIAASLKMQRQMKKS